jgi:hypothetical protein
MLAVALFLLALGLAAAALLPACARCSQDNAYLGFLFYPMLFLVAAIGCAVVWVATGRRMPLPRSIVVGIATGAAAGALFLALGVSRLLPGGLLDLALWSLALAGGWVTYRIASRA